MRDTLYIQLREPDADGRVPYALAGSQPELGLRTEHATLDTILGLAAGRRVVVFVPGADVRLAAVTVPARQPQKVLQAAPYALEDQMAEDVDTLHFAIGPRQAGGSHPVAVASRERMDGWLSPLRARGVTPDALLPETLCLPTPEPDQWTAMVETERVVVRSGAYSGFACPLADLDSYLQLADPDARMRMRLFVTGGVDQDFTRLNRPVELIPGHAETLDVLVRYYRPESGINLLQGAYSQKEDWRRLAQPWRAAAAIALAWAGLALAHASVQSHRLGQELKSQDDKNLARFQALFPAETKIVDLAAQTEQKLTALQGGATNAPWFQLLEVVSAALAANPGLSVKSLQFREGALYLSLTGSDLQAFESMRVWFESRRDARISDVQANSGTDGVQVRLKMTLA